MKRTSFLASVAAALALPLLPAIDNPCAEISLPEDAVVFESSYWGFMRAGQSTPMWPGMITQSILDAARKQGARIWTITYKGDWRYDDLLDVTDIGYIRSLVGMRATR